MLEWIAYYFLIGLLIGIIKFYCAAYRKQTPDKIRDEYLKGLFGWLPLLLWHGLILWGSFTNFSYWKEQLGKNRK